MNKYRLELSVGSNNIDCFLLHVVFSHMRWDFCHKQKLRGIFVDILRRSTLRHLTFSSLVDTVYKATFCKEIRVKGSKMQLSILKQWLCNWTEELEYLVGASTCIDLIFLCFQYEKRRIIWRILCVTRIMWQFSKNHITEQWSANELKFSLKWLLFKLF